jgi:hypothetical protein
LDFFPPDVIGEPKRDGHSKIELELVGLGRKDGIAGLLANPASAGVADKSCSKPVAASIKCDC